jgi:hypothetical protein
VFGLFGLEPDFGSDEVKIEPGAGLSFEKLLLC